MRNLHNEEDWRILKDKMLDSDQNRITISFYQYAQIKNPQFFRDYLFIHWSEMEVFGRIYIAQEGINAQLSLPTVHYDLFRAHLYSISFLDGIRLNLAIDDDGKSFYKLVMKVKSKILADGLVDQSFDVTNRGHHLDASAFNQLTSKTDTVLVDMRNHYEHEVGYFKNAITPDVDTFRDSLPYILKNLRGLEQRNIVMYCTGGIRCEKASAWLKHKGFKNVHQLSGGIIEYTRQVKNEKIENRFVGKNFVFDERLGERISDEIVSSCHQCGQPADSHTNCVNKGCHLLFIQCETCREKYENCCSDECKEIVNLPEKQQLAMRKGKDRGQMIFKKGRSTKLLFKKPHSF